MPALDLTLRYEDENGFQKENDYISCCVHSSRKSSKKKENYNNIIIYDEFNQLLRTDNDY